MTDEHAGEGIDLQEPHEEGAEVEAPDEGEATGISPQDQPEEGQGGIGGDTEAPQEDGE